MSRPDLRCPEPRSAGAVPTGKPIRRVPRFWTRLATSFLPRGPRLPRRSRCLWPNLQHIRLLHAPARRLLDLSTQRYPARHSRNRCFGPIGDFTYQTSLWTGGPLDGLETAGRFNPSVGVELVSNFQPSIFIDGVGFVDQRQDFSPPVLSSPPEISIGQVVQTSGALTQTYSNAFESVSLPGTYSVAYRLALVEPISVPFGSFDAIQRQIQLDLALQISPAQWEEVRATSRDWIVPGLGSVRQELTFPSRIDIYELVDTNRMFIPEARSASGHLTAATTMAAIWLSRRGKRRGPTRTPHSPWPPCRRAPLEPA